MIGLFRVTGSLRYLILASTLLALTACKTSIRVMGQKRTLSKVSDLWSFSLTIPHTNLRGGETLPLNLSVTDPKGTIASIVMEYSVDSGSTYATATTITLPDPSPVWNVPMVDISDMRIRMKVIAHSGDSENTSPISATVDSTPPDAPVVTLISANPARLLPTTLSVANCNDTDSLWISESAATPLATDSGWQSCVSAPSNLSFNLSSADGMKSLTVWAKDAVGNVSAASTPLSIDLDRTAPTLSLTAPSLGQTLSGGSASSITWTAADAHFGTTPIRLEFSSDNGVNWTDIVAAQANTGTLAWTLPSIDTATAKVRATATDTAGNSTVDGSGAFAIDSSGPTVAVVSPNGGEFVRGGGTHTITWTATDPHLAANPISLKWYNGAIWLSVPGATNIANTGSFTWNVTPLNLTTARVRVIAVDTFGHSTSDDSNADFTIDKDAPAVSLTFPNGGDYIRGGAANTITWSASDTNIAALPISLEVSDDSGATWTSIASGLANTGSYAWTAPAVNSTTYKVRVKAVDKAGNELTIQSSGDFTIDSIVPTLSLASPNGGEILPSGIFNVTYTASDTNFGASAISAEYSADGGVTWASAGAAAMNTGLITVNAPAGNSDTVRIRLTATDLAGNKTTDTSDANFTTDATAPVLQLTSPTGTLASGSIHTLTWKLTEAHSSAIQTFVVEYSTNTGTTWTFVDSPPAANGPLTNQTFTYDWTVPSASTAVAMIRVYYYDLAGLQAIADSTTFGIDNSPPTISSTTFPTGVIAGGSTQSILFSLADSGSGLEPTAKIQYAANGTTFTDIATIPSTDTSYSWTAPSDNTSTAKIRIVVKDAAGQTTTATSAAFIIDSTSPTLALTGYAAGGLGAQPGTTIALTWNAVDANFDATAIKIEYNVNGAGWVTLENGVTNSGTYSQLVPGGWTEPDVFRFRLTATDRAGHSVTATGTNNTVSTTSPGITVGSMSINGGVSPAANNNLSIAISATSPTNPIQYGCFKFSLGTVVPSAPAVGDSCWTAINLLGGTQAPTVTLTNAPFPIGFTPGDYTIYAWFKDSAGNISALTNAGAGTDATDKATISYDPGTPAIIADLIVANTDAPSAPILATEMNAPSGSTIFVKWKITDDKVIPAGAIRLDYTFDDKIFTPIITGLDNSTNGSCTLTGSATGCYTWTGGSPSSGYLKIRVSITDSSNMTALSSSAPMNTGQFQMLAGNTELGLGGSATAAVLLRAGQGEYGDYKTFVMTNNGTVYYRDYVRGILKIDPQSGMITTFIRTTGSYSGEGGNAASATLANPARITLDYQDRLLIWDNGRILRVETQLATPTIATLIGGGGSSADTEVATNLSLAGWIDGRVLFQSLPNGDLIFQTSEDWSFNSGIRIRHYHAATGMVSSILLTGDGSYSEPARVLGENRSNGGGYLAYFAIRFDPLTSTLLDIGGASFYPYVGGYGSVDGVSFDPATGINRGAAGPHMQVFGSVYFDGSKFNSRNGDLYGVARRFDNYMAKYNPATNAWETILGTGTRGNCPDGTLATACNVAIEDAFVTLSNQIFFLDAGMIRVIDGDGKVKTVFGQSKFFGDGGLPTSARLGNVQWLDVNSSGQVAVSDLQTDRIRLITPGVSVQTIVGNGISNAGPYASGLGVNSPFEANPWPGQKTIAFEPGTDNLLISTGGAVVRMAADNSMSYFAGGGGTDWSAGDGLVGTDLGLGGYMATVLGVGDGKALVSNYSWDGTQGINSLMKTFEIGSRVQAHFAGNLGPISGGSFNADGANTATSWIPGYSTVPRMSFDSTTSSWLIGVDGHTRIVSAVQGGTLSTRVTLPRSFQSFAYVRTPDEMIYSCAYDGTTWRLYKYNITTSTETMLDWPSDTLHCAGKTLIWNAARNSLIFPVSQNGMAGVGEYLNP